MTVVIGCARMIARRTRRVAVVIAHVAVMVIAHARRVVIRAIGPVRAIAVIVIGNRIFLIDAGRSPGRAG